ncbi:MAG: hypothetical protein V1790_11525 [Planctomycetota bacterium]
MVTRGSLFHNRRRVTHSRTSLRTCGRLRSSVTKAGNGIRGSLERKRAEGADVRVVGSIQSALETARNAPDKQVVFVAVGLRRRAPPPTFHALPRRKSS